MARSRSVSLLRGGGEVASREPSERESSDSEREGEEARLLINESIGE